MHLTQEFDLALETGAYQQCLEMHRMNPDHDEIYQDMLKAKAQMEVAYLQHSVKK